MAWYHKCDVKNDFAYVLQFFSLISDSLGSVKSNSRYEQHPFALAYEAGNESLASTKNSSNSEIP